MWSNYISEHFCLQALYRTPLFKRKHTSENEREVWKSDDRMWESKGEKMPSRTRGRAIDNIQFKYFQRCIPLSNINCDGFGAFVGIVQFNSPWLLCTRQPFSCDAKQLQCVNSFSRVNNKRLDRIRGFFPPFYCAFHCIAVTFYAIMIIVQFIFVLY